MHEQWLRNVRAAMNLELREISLMAQLAEQLPSAAMRAEVIGKIAEEANEAAVWNAIHASYCQYPSDPGPGYGPGCGPGPGYGPGQGYGPGPGFDPGQGYGPGPGPGFYEAGEKEEPGNQKGGS